MNIEFQMKCEYNEDLLQKMFLPQIPKLYINDKLIGYMTECKPIKQIVKGDDIMVDVTFKVVGVKGE